MEAEENAEGAARIWMRHGADKMGGEEVIDEAFIDVLCDALLKQARQLVARIRDLDHGLPGTQGKTWVELDARDLWAIRGGL